MWMATEITVWNLPVLSTCVEPNDMFSSVEIGYFISFTENTLLWLRMETLFIMWEYKCIESMHSPIGLIYGALFDTAEFV